MSNLMHYDPNKVVVYVDGVVCEGFADDIEIRLERGTNEAVSKDNLSVSGSVEVDGDFANQISLWLARTNEENE